MTGRAIPTSASEFAAHVRLTLDAGGTMADAMKSWKAIQDASSNRAARREPAYTARCERCGYGLHLCSPYDPTGRAIPTRATVCERCGSGLLDGKHIASYPPCNGEDAIPNRVADASREFLFGPFGEKSAAEEADATRNREADDEWQFTSEKGNVFDLPFYRDGYLAGWRQAMTEAKGGDWSQEVPDALR